jgi:hypothetical protein
MIRMIENLLVSLPFIIFFLYRQSYLTPVILTVFALLLAPLSAKIPSIVVIPTPFGKHPYEFASGFRKTLLFFLAGCGLTVIAIAVDNFNLGVLTIILNMFVICSFYLQKEDVYYVWQYVPENKNIFDLPLNRYVSEFSTGMKKKLAIMAILLQGNT